MIQGGDPDILEHILNVLYKRIGKFFIKTDRPLYLTNITDTETQACTTGKQSQFADSPRLRVLGYSE